MYMRFQSLGQSHETDYQQQSRHLTFCRISEEPIEIPLFLMDHFFVFSIHLERGRP